MKKENEDFHMRDIGTSEMPLEASACPNVKLRSLFSPHSRSEIYFPLL